MSRRPRIAALGGGTGLASLLRGLKRAPAGHHRDRDGGRRRRLVGAAAARARRAAAGRHPQLPGGAGRRRVALGPLFQHRFADGDLAGHAFGNLFLAALTEVTGQLRPGDPGVQPGAEHPRPRAALHARPDPPVGRARRRRAPSAGRPASPGAAGPAGGCGWSPSRGPTARRSRRSPRPTWCCSAPGASSPACCPTSRCPSWPRRSRRRRGRRAYVCNVMTQPGETDGFDAADHLERVLEAVPGGVDMVVVHDGPLDPDVAATYAAQGQEPVAIDAERLQRPGRRGRRRVTSRRPQRWCATRRRPSPRSSCAWSRTPLGAEPGPSARRACVFARATPERRDETGLATVATNSQAAV